MTPDQVQSLVTQYAQQYGVDPSLALAVAQTESNFNPAAVSPAGAIGVMQLMPSTAAGLGVNPNDPTQNIQGGVQYLAQLLQKYDGDATMALWAYNAGPGNVSAGVLPAETQAYIPAVVSRMAQWGGAGVSNAVNSLENFFSGTSSTPADFISSSSPADSSLIWWGVGLAGAALLFAAFR